MAKVKTSYKCSNCGQESRKWLGKCPSCNSWNTMEEFTEEVIKVGAQKLSQQSIKGIDKSVRLVDVENSSEERFETGIGEFDRVLGGGIVRGSINVITAPPGTGKSTLLSSISNEAGKRGIKVVYASGEESERQIRMRANRILDELSENVYISPGDNLDNIFASIDKHDAELVIIDSIQTCSVDYIDGKVGGNAQILECAERLRRRAKNSDSSKKALMVIIIGQMTKEDELAGSRQLEHLVDSVLLLEAQESLRMLKSTKNRFGSIGEVGMFEMDSCGLVPIDDPKKYFLTERDAPIIGNARSIVKEGTRSIPIEVECAVSRSLQNFPARNAEGLRREKLNILIGILEGTGVNFFEENVAVKPCGGVTLKNNDTDLALLMSMVSAKKKKAIPDTTVFLGEVGLTGEIKKIPFIEERIEDLNRMGFDEVIIPNQVLKSNMENLRIKITKMKTINDCIRYVFPTTTKK